MVCNGSLELLYWVGNSQKQKNIKEISYISRKQKLFKLAPLLSLASSSCRKASTGRRKASSIPQEWWQETYCETTMNQMNRTWSQSNWWDHKHQQLSASFFVKYLSVVNLPFTSAGPLGPQDRRTAERQWRISPSPLLDREDRWDRNGESIHHHWWAPAFQFPTSRPIFGEQVLDWGLPVWL